MDISNFLNQLDDLVKEIKPNIEKFMGILNNKIKPYSEENYNSIYNKLSQILEKFKEYTPDAQKQLKELLNKIISSVNIIDKKYSGAYEQSELNKAYTTFINSALDGFIGQTNVTNNIDLQQTNDSTGFEDSANPNKERRVTNEAFTQLDKDTKSTYQKWFDEIVDKKLPDGVDDITKELAVVYAYLYMYKEARLKGESPIKQQANSLANLTNMLSGDLSGSSSKSKLISGIKNIVPEKFKVTPKFIDRLYKDIASTIDRR